MSAPPSSFPFHPLSHSLSLPLPRRLFLSGFLFAAAAAIIGRSVVRPCFLHSQIIITEGGMRCERGSGEGRRRIGRREELVRLCQGKFGRERGREGAASGTCASTCLIKFSSGIGITFPRHIMGGDSDDFWVGESIADGAFQRWNRSEVQSRASTTTSETSRSVRPRHARPPLQLNHSRQRARGGRDPRPSSSSTQNCFYNLPRFLSPNAASRRCSRVTTVLATDQACFDVAVLKPENQQCFPTKIAPHTIRPLVCLQSVVHKSRRGRVSRISEVVKVGRLSAFRVRLVRSSSCIITSIYPRGKKGREGQNWHRDGRRRRDRPANC